MQSRDLGQLADLSPLGLHTSNGLLALGWALLQRGSLRFTLQACMALNVQKGVVKEGDLFFVATP